MPGLLFRLLSYVLIAFYMSWRRSDDILFEMMNLNDARLKLFGIFCILTLLAEGMLTLNLTIFNAKQEKQQAPMTKWFFIVTSPMFAYLIALIIGEIVFRLFHLPISGYPFFKRWVDLFLLPLMTLQCSFLIIMTTIMYKLTQEDMLAIPNLKTASKWLVSEIAREREEYKQLKADFIATLIKLSEVGGKNAKLTVIEDEDSIWTAKEWWDYRLAHVTSYMNEEPYTLKDTDEVLFEDFAFYVREKENPIEIINWFNEICYPYRTDVIYREIISDDKLDLFLAFRGRGHIVSLDFTVNDFDKVVIALATLVLPDIEIRRCRALPKGNPIFYLPLKPDEWQQLTTMFGEEKMALYFAPVRENDREVAKFIAALEHPFSYPARA